ncbi:poly-gamma-glutamate system protein [Fusobacterium sp. PH5-44]|uniref:poly-gamma-glutamate system protein n=1 Tax=unclassified Fusobacterium TaxID=2648384 RepID=UPI003D1E1A98
MKKENIIIVITFLFFLFFQFYLKKNMMISKTKYYDRMIEASQNMQKISDKIKEEKIKRKYVIDPHIDINMTGLIGEEYTGITTTLGNIEAKRASVNPDFSAIFVKLFLELGLKKGDYVAANLSSSFPGLNLSLISALDTLELNGVLITTIGASSYGGNIIDFNYLDMEYFLFSSGSIRNRSIGFSLGGSGDIGSEFPDDLKNEIIMKNKNRDLQFFYNEDLDDNINERYQYYKKNGEIKAFVNIGGNILSTKGEVDIDNKKILITVENTVKNGLIGKFLQNKIPVLYLLGMREISNYYKIPYDQKGEYKIGMSQIYYEKNNILNYIIIICFILFVLCLKRKKYKNI